MKHVSKGTIHARDFRTSNCMAVGDGSQVTTLELNMLAAKGARDYCGVLVNNVSFLSLPE
jgi:hypothetical protein